MTVDIGIVMFLHIISAIFMAWPLYALITVNERPKAGAAIGDKVDDFMEGIIKILKEAKIIAVVGCSRDPEKASHKVPKYLKEHGYKIIPVNPLADEILGEKVYKSLSEINEEVDIVDIFRPSEECLQVVQQAIKLKPKIIWMQLGIKNEEAARLAEKKGVKVIMDRCIMIEHKRLIK